VGAAAERVDRPLEPIATAGHSIEGRLRDHLVESNAQRLRGVERPRHRFHSQTEQPACLLVLDPLLVPPHTNTCSHMDGLMFTSERVLLFLMPLYRAKGTERDEGGARRSPCG